MKKLLSATMLAASLSAAMFGLDHGHEASAAQTPTTTTFAAGNHYTPGQCTWYVYNRVGGRIGSNWGNANHWSIAARSAGYRVNHRPAAGSIFQSSAGAFGHVAYVTRVSRRGAVHISEMNYSRGPFKVNHRIIPARHAHLYHYIHV